MYMYSILEIPSWLLPPHIGPEMFILASEFIIKSIAHRDYDYSDYSDYSDCTDATVELTNI